MRQTAQKAGVSLGTVSNVIDEAKKSSRIVYVYMDRKNQQHCWTFIQQ